MRKKLLRSRSGFEKPESREEAIMQNILGASNVLEPSESNIEEILKSILYNTPYTKEAEFEIEKILLAIKNNGTYDGEGESRDMKILIAILNDLDYTEEAESRIEELFIEWLHQRSSIKVLEGIPPLTFTSIGLPLINYLIEGNTVQSGTPTPDNPIMPQGTGERTENLFDTSTVTSGKYVRDTDGTLGNFEDTSASDYIDVSNITTLYPKYFTEQRPVRQWAAFYDSSKTFVSGFSGYNKAITVPNDVAYVRLTVDNSYISNFTVSSSQLDNYEPYGQYKIPISSAGQTTTVYLGEVETTRRIKKLVLDGTENWLMNADGWFYLTSVSDDYLRSEGNITSMCSHYPTYKQASAIAQLPEGYTGFSWGSVQRLYLKDTSHRNDLSNFKQWVAAQYAAGTPVCVWYVLATEETAVVNEPLQKIGDYADTLSMEQAGVEIPTNNGSTTLDVDTTVKPSNIYIEYK